MTFVRNGYGQFGWLTSSAVEHYFTYADHYFHLQDGIPPSYVEVFSKGYYLNSCKISLSESHTVFECWSCKLGKPVVKFTLKLDPYFWFCLFWALRLPTCSIGSVFVFGSLWQMQTTFFCQICCWQKGPHSQHSFFFLDSWQTCKIQVDGIPKFYFNAAIYTSWNKQQDELNRWRKTPKGKDRVPVPSIFICFLVLVSRESMHLDWGNFSRDFLAKLLGMKVKTDH